MTFGILLWPHGNPRYQDAIKPLALSELTLALGEEGCRGAPAYRQIAQTDFLCFDSTLSEAALIERLSTLAHLQMLFQITENGEMRPLCSRREAYLGWDLPSILKYKGKTNEVFTRFLLNLALLSSEFEAKNRRLTVFDPMCGRGTTLFEAINRGFHAVGADIDKADIHEADAFFRRYLEYHKIKHRQTQSGMTLPGGRSVLRRQYEFAGSPEAYKAGDTLRLSMMQADALDAIRAFPEKSFHLAVCDLPYGVQHQSAGRGKAEPIEPLLSRVLPMLRTRMKVGGAAALSFNANTLPKSRLVKALSDAGFAVLTGASYDHLAHWVEQAVTRDAVVARLK